MSKLDPLRQAVAVSPDNVPLLLLLAHACLDEWSLDEARSIFERVLTLDPARPEARVGIARILHLSGKTSEAVVRTEALIVQHPQFAPAHLLLARLHAGEGNLEAARTSYARALAIDPMGKDPSLEKELNGPIPKSPEPEKVTVSGPCWTPEDEEEE
jgi:cytochrome c-type biogenesis protein CcmH/NrfG